MIKITETELLRLMTESFLKGKNNYGDKAFAEDAKQIILDLRGGDE